MYYIESLKAHSLSQILLSCNGSSLPLLSCGRRHVNHATWLALWSTCDTWRGWYTNRVTCVVVMSIDCTPRPSIMQAAVADRGMGIENKSFSYTTHGTRDPSRQTERDHCVAVLWSIFSITILHRNAVTVQGRQRVMVIKIIHLHFGWFCCCWLAEEWSGVAGWDGGALVSISGWVGNTYVYII